MKPAEAYYMYIALKLHFTSENYDYIKFNGKLKKAPQFALIKDKWQMNKFARQPDPKGLAISNMVRKPKIWVRDLLSEEGTKNYAQYKRYLSEPVECFKLDLERLDSNPVTNFRATRTTHPLALRLYLGGHISPYTLAVLNKLSGNLFAHWNSELKDDIVAKPAIFALVKFAPFVNCDNPGFLPVLQKRFMRV